MHIFIRIYGGVNWSFVFHNVSAKKQAWIGTVINRSNIFMFWNYFQIFQNLEYKSTIGTLFEHVPSAEIKAPGLYMTTFSTYRWTHKALISRGFYPTFTQKSKDSAGRHSKILSNPIGVNLLQYSRRNSQTKLTGGVLRFMQ